jgi:arylsulfatase
MLYTLNDAKAPDRRKSQIFELVSNRGMYQNGWMASSMPICPGRRLEQATTPTSPMGALHIDQDFSQANDLAAQYPEKLKAAGRPVVGRKRHATTSCRSTGARSSGCRNNSPEGRASPRAARNRSTTRRSVALPEAAAPDLKNKSSRSRGSRHSFGGAQG